MLNELGIYIHIPFCKQKCYYCDFVSYSNKCSEVKEYIESGEKIEEIRMSTFSYDKKMSGQAQYEKDHIERETIILKARQDENYREKALAVINNTHDIEARMLGFQFENGKVTLISYAYFTPQNIRATALD